MDTATFDVAVVGGGAAGLSAALVLGRARRDVIVIDGGNPRNAPAAHMQGFISRDGMSPAALLEAARTEVEGYGVGVAADEVVEIEAGFALSLASGRRVHARRLVVATGAGDEIPEIAGARERWGRDFLHCPYCHGWEVRDQPLGVLGTGPHSVEYAHLLRQWSDDIIFFAHTQAVTREEHAGLEARGVTVLAGRVTEFAVVDDRLDAVHLDDGRAIPRRAVFMRPSLHPRGTHLVVPLGVDVDAEGGFIRVDSNGQTTARGVWAVGNVANPRAQVITAAGEGSAAAIAINNDLVRKEIELALRAPQEEFS
jgi:thioredoxin reductase